MDILTIMLDHRTKVDLGRYSLAPTINYAIDSLHSPGSHNKGIYELIMIQKELELLGYYRRGFWYFCLPPLTQFLDSFCQRGKTNTHSLDYIRDGVILFENQLS